MIGRDAGFIPAWTPMRWEKGAERTSGCSSKDWTIHGTKAQLTVDTRKRWKRVGTDLGQRYQTEVSEGGT